LGSNNTGKYSNVVQGLVLLSAGIVLYYFIIPWQIPTSDAWAEMSSTFFPKIGVGLLMFLAGVLIIDNMRSPKKRSGYAKIEESATETSATQRGKLWAGILVCFGYVLVMNLVGFLIATFSILVVLMYLMGQRNPRIIFSIAVSFTALVYYVFSKILIIQLPEGLLSF
jgi:hypothetical protein